MLTETQRKQWRLARDHSYAAEYYRTMLLKTSDKEIAGKCRSLLRRHTALMQWARQRALLA